MVDHTLKTFKMHLSRRFAPAIVVITSSVALSILAVLSLGESFTAVVSGEGWLTTTGKKWRRDDADTLPLSFPWE